MAADEASKRSAVSRAYYAAYGVASQRQKSDGIPLMSGSRLGSHQRLWGAYKQHSDPRRRQIGIDGDRLRAKRIQADYNEGLCRPAWSASAVTSAAGGLIQALDGL